MISVSQDIARPVHSEQPSRKWITGLICPDIPSVSNIIIVLGITLSYKGRSIPEGLPIKEGYKGLSGQKLRKIHLCNIVVTIE
jgi:hypothetical protein